MSAREGARKAWIRAVEERNTLAVMIADMVAAGSPVSEERLASYRVVVAKADACGAAYDRVLDGGVS